MDSHFQNVMFDVINQFLERLSERILLPKEKLWTTWKEMFNFPNQVEVKKPVKRIPKDKVKDESVDAKKATPPKEKSKEKKIDSFLVQKVQEKVEAQNIIEQPSSILENVVEYVAPVATVVPLATVEKVTTEQVVEYVAPVVEYVAPTASTPPTVPVIESKPKERSVDKESSGGCHFVITRGERAGKNCGKQIAKKSDKFCATHCK